MAERNQYVTGIALAQFIYGAKSLEINVKDVLEQSGLGNEHLKPSACVPCAKYEIALLKLILANENNSFGVDIGQQIMPPLYGVLMSLILSSPSLGEALKYMARYQGLATGNCGQVEYVQSGGFHHLNIAMTHQNPVIRRHISECVLAMFCGLLRLITSREDMLPEELRLEHAPYSEASKRHLESAAGCAVLWNSGETQLVLSEGSHQFQIFGHGDELLRIAESQARQQLEQINKKLSDIEKIKWHAGELMLSSSPRRETVAHRLQISTRTLDRRLEDGGTSWQEMIDGLRLQSALKHLATPDTAISEIAYKLGFTEIRAFQKSFKKWTGLTPTAYRKKSGF